MITVALLGSNEGLLRRLEDVTQAYDHMRASSALALEQKEEALAEKDSEIAL
jgi:hypothetical protein